MDIVFDTSLVHESTIMVAVIGYVTVFTSLVLLFMVFRSLPKLIAVLSKMRTKTKETLANNGNWQKKQSEVTDISGEVNAAISAAIHHYLNEIHDDEDMVLTLQKMSRTYSPWSSKIYSVINFRR
ncbi:hypothetical protein FNH22_09630 [Fulvivirga sp. M361]|uniref:OadG family protein n=1 Tax=Fulvivirga sp. M361 TaxID=2594266 RepID=UPI00117A9525|nr:OadG family protein [Fulvivirga sp. M361]TRX59416.1 hypothetical protein FNH22_09630 [Fulvivirga sp. M361]